MKYIRFKLDDGTPIKFKFFRNPYDLYLRYKVDKIFSKKHDIFICDDCSIDTVIRRLERMTDDEIIKEYKHRIKNNYEDYISIKRRVW